jgi:hypothetical protein
MTDAVPKCSDEVGYVASLKYQSTKIFERFPLRHDVQYDTVLVTHFHYPLIAANFREQCASVITGLLHDISRNATPCDASSPLYTR